MKQGFVKSSPRFFSLIERSIYGLLALLLTLAAFVPAPLQEQADRAVTPNPAKSAWFLLWIQELVSWSRHMIWPVTAVLVLAVALPWFPRTVRPHRAVWFQHGERAVAGITLLVAALLLLLTIVAMFFRGADWLLVL